jgi:hypothetical protein
VKNPIASWSFERRVTGTVVGVAVLAAVGSLIERDIDNYPAWLESIATTLALAAAVFAARYAYRAFELETDRDERFLAQQRSSQAELVSAWPGSFSYEAGDLDPYGDGTGKPGLYSVQVYLRNASAAPVTSVWIDASFVIQLPDGPHRVHFAAQQVKRILPPTSEPDGMWIRADTPIEPADYTADEDPEYWAELSISFRDAGGRTWKRLAEGQLHLVMDADE